MFSANANQASSKFLNALLQGLHNDLKKDDLSDLITDHIEPITSKRRNTEVIHSGVTIYIY